MISVGIGDPSSPLSGGDDVVHFQSENATQIVPSPDGKWIAFSERWHAFVAPSGAVAFVGARVITMDGATVVENGTVVVEGNRVTAVGRDVAIPAGAKRIDASGKTIMPGIIDVH